MRMGFICEFENRVDWELISANQQLSKEFIIKFTDRVNWYCFSRYQILSEDFIRELILNREER